MADDDAPAGAGSMAMTEGAPRVAAQRAGAFPLSRAFGPWAVVTGASDGIGREIAVELARAGLSLVLCARRGGDLERLAQQLRADHGVEVRTAALDLADRPAIEALLSGTRDLDVGLLVAAAGFGASGLLLAGDADTDAAMVDVNCRAVVLLAKGFGRRFVDRGRGGLVLMSSLLAWQGQPRAANYAATKAYVHALAEGLRAELAPFGVHVLAVAPGPVASGFARRADMRMSAATSSRTVARGVVRALAARRSVTVPGGLSKLLTWSLLPLPRALRVRIMAGVMSSMTRHQGPA